MTGGRTMKRTTGTLSVPTERTIAPARRRARGAIAAIANAAVALAALAGQASANEVVRSEGVSCSLHCQDTFEVKCTQTTARFCVTVTGQSDGTAQFRTTGVAVSPAADLGEAYETVGGPTESRSVCFYRSGSAG